MFPVECEVPWGVDPSLCFPPHLPPPPTRDVHTTTCQRAGIIGADAAFVSRAEFEALRSQLAAVLAPEGPTLPQV